MNRGLDSNTRPWKCVGQLAIYSENRVNFPKTGDTLVAYIRIARSSRCFSCPLKKKNQFRDNYDEVSFHEKNLSHDYLVFIIVTYVKR